MKFYAFTNITFETEKHLQKAILQYILTFENNVVSEINSNPFNNKKMITFLKNGYCFLAVNLHNETNEISFETKQILTKELKSVSNESIDISKEKILQSNTCIYFYFSYLEKIREDYENLLLFVVEFFQTKYDATIIQYIEKSKTTFKVLLW